MAQNAVRIWQNCMWAAKKKQRKKERERVSEREREMNVYIPVWIVHSLCIKFAALLNFYGKRSLLMLYASAAGEHTPQITKEERKWTIDIETNEDTIKKSRNTQI